MNEQRKIIFKEALFNVPFLLIAGLVTLAVMFKSGRSAFDIEQIILSNFRSTQSISADPFLKTESKSYKVEYYYGDTNDEVLFAEFEYSGRGDDPKSTLTLYEARDGFDPGVYSTAWFLGEEYVTYWPIGSSAEGDGFEKYLSTEVPLMFNLVNSYSWEGAANTFGASESALKGYSMLGVKLFLWDFSDNGVMRENFIWGIGGNPREMYSYIQGSQGEYKKAVLK
ncbi:MAG: hypothetical protein IIY78_01505 [Clostridia bacterium]|nr:hypothetical protein [Clostridia bacterium]